MTVISVSSRGALSQKGDVAISVVEIMRRLPRPSAEGLAMTEKKIPFILSLSKDVRKRK
jgi:hypothetical protein